MPLTAALGWRSSSVTVGLFLLMRSANPCGATCRALSTRQLSSHPGIAGILPACGPEARAPRGMSAPPKLFPFKTLTGELERPAVLGDGAHDVIGRTRGDFGFYLQGHSHFCPYQAG